MDEQEYLEEIKALKQEIEELKEMLIDTQLKHMEMMEEHMHIKKLMSEHVW